MRGPSRPLSHLIKCVFLAVPIDLSDSLTYSSRFNLPDPAALPPALTPTPAATARFPDEWLGEAPFYVKALHLKCCEMIRSRAVLSTWNCGKTKNKVLCGEAVLEWKDWEARKIRVGLYALKKKCKTEYLERIQEIKVTHRLEQWGGRWWLPFPVYVMLYF